MFQISLFGHAGVQAVFHIAAIVGPFFPHALYEKVLRVWGHADTIYVYRYGHFGWVSGELSGHAQRDRCVPRMRRHQTCGLLQSLHAL